ncbi:hypothetical protein AUJ83_03780 [Candidatus Woesearchaeota archaeon CG1_02_33_12]|nr:MAG: hypothetical protein AUJ83_03780 [Candidatus Woesearchaeota archaeon CG1_02_33_12]PIN78495.1 MAG: hypothetical protein COV14_03650 [Candidatus Woesearchaeota archaeon CG10_big_fil_rev_8_21_14_0_10_33_12]
MPSITLTIPNKVKVELKEFAWVNWSEFARQEIFKHELFTRLNSPKERELIKWSVELGRKVKKGRLKRLLAELSPKEREELLK